MSDTEHKELSTILAQTLSSNRENLTKYSALLDLCPLPAFFLDKATKTPTYINPAYFEMTGHTLDELQRADWLAVIVHPDDLPRVLETWSSFTKEGTLFIHWHRYVSADGQVTRATAVIKKLDDTDFVGFVLPKCDSDFDCPIAKINKMATGTRC